MVFENVNIPGALLLLDLKKRGLNIPPKLCVGDGAMGFWKAIKKEYGEQTAKVLDA